MIRKMTTILILIFNCLVLSAPSLKVCYLPINERLQNPYQYVINLIVEAESSGDTFAFNEKESARGAFQIRPVRLNDFNHRTGNRYKLKDCFNYDVSERIFLYYASDFAPGDLKGICYEWNKSTTDKYYNKVLKLKNL